jgi:hypothetical protein
MAFSDASNELNTDRVLRIFGGAQNLLLGTLVVSIVVSLLLWFFVSRRASNFAKWVQVVFTGFGLVSFAGVAISPEAFKTSDLAIMIIANGLQIAATGMLFRTDSRAWFAGRKPVDPNVFS